MSKLDVDLSSDQHLARRKKAITVLAWSGPGFFGTWILINTVQALVLGRGIGRGKVAPFDPDDIHGHGLLVDAGLFLVTTLVLVAIIAGWYWIMSMLKFLNTYSGHDVLPGICSKYIIIFAIVLWAEMHLYLSEIKIIKE